MAPLPKAELFWPEAAARLPTAVANAPLAVAPTHWVWPGVAVAQSCAKAAGAAMAISTAAARVARTGVLLRA